MRAHIGAVSIATGRRVFPLVLTLVAFVGVYAPTLVWLFDRWMMGVWYHAHGLLVPFISTYLIWKKLKSPSSPDAGADSGLGFLFLIPALLMHVADTVIWSQILSAVSIVPAVIGLSFIFIGRDKTLSIWVPLILLIFMIPIPSAAIQFIVIFLRTATAIGTAFVFDLLDVPVLRSGSILEMPNAAVNIANACSGFSTMLATLIFTILLLYIWKLGHLGKFILLAMVIPVAIFSNIVRAITLIALIMQYGRTILGTFLHPLSGYVAYLIAIGLQAALHIILRKKEPVI